MNLEKTNRYFTQTIVGAPMELRVGIATKAKNGFQWGPDQEEDPPEVSPKAPRRAFRELLPSFSLPKFQKPSRPRLSFLLIGGAALIGTAFVAVRLYTPNNLAVEVAAPQKANPGNATPLSSINVEAAPFAAAQPQQHEQAAAPAGDGPLPFARPVAGSITPVESAAPQSPTPAPAGPVNVAPKAKEAEKPSPSALVLDKPDEKAKQVAPAQTPAAQVATNKVVPQTAVPVTPAKTQAPAAAPVVAGPPSEPAVPITVVDIDKKGAFVLLTNPATRLPEKFSVGQKIFTGETITKIDPSAGKIQLGTRTIGMQ